MKATGIVRRIDELGRVVIPKEIRRTLRIKEGDPLEIFTERDELLLKKYSPLETLENMSAAVAESLSSITEKNVVICDTDSIIYAAASAKDLVGKSISAPLEEILRGRKSYYKKKCEGAEIISLFRGEDRDWETQIIEPIIAKGDVLGGIILLSDEINDEEAIDIKLIKLAAEFLARQFEY